MHRTVLALVLALALVAAACGGTREDEGSTAAPDTTTTVADDTTPPDATAAPDATTPPDDTGGPGDVTTTAAPDDVVVFGDVEVPCRPGDTSTYTDTDQGVTADTIRIGTGDDSGFETSPGLNIEIGDAVEAMVAWCNELGGINGRTIELERYDAKLFEIQNVMLSACQDEFMLVGHGFVIDNLGEQTRVECGLPSVPAYTVSPQAANGPLMIQPVPNPADYFPVGNQVYVAENFPEAAANSGIMYGNIAATTDTKDKVIASTADLGLPIEWKIELEYNAQGEDDWTPFVLQLKNAGVEHLYFSGTCLPTLIGFMETAGLNDFEPIVTAETNFYARSCAEANTRNEMDGLLVRMVIHPFEEADIFPAVAQYLDLLDQRGGSTSTLGMQAVSAFLLWATGADACGAELTRECVFDRIAEIDDWTGGGLHAPTNPASNLPAECGYIMTLEGTEYRRVHPPEPGELECRADTVGRVTGPVVDQAQLDDDRVSQAFTTG